LNRLLSLYGLAAAGRFETEVFTPATLVGLERYRARIQATFAPPGWGGLTVRAAWGPSCGGAGVDLEVQASASSVGQLRDLEVVVQSQWRRRDEPESPAARARRVWPRDARSAAFSYDGREPARVLHALTTQGPATLPQPQVLLPPGPEANARYIEMVQPNDVARIVRLEPSEPEGPLLENLALRYALFGHDFEKGVVFRARLRACWLSDRATAREAATLYREFLAEPLPLGP
jgi:hypothetical protein